MGKMGIITKTIIIVMFINVLLYLPGIVRYFSEEAERAQTPYAVSYTSSDGRVWMTFFEQVTLSQRQIDSIETAVKKEMETLNLDIPWDTVIIYWETSDTLMYHLR